MTGRRSRAIAGAAALALAVPGVSQASVTIGSNLSSTPNSEAAEGTWVNNLLEEALRAPGGLRSPVNGVITRWRLKTGKMTAPVALRVIEPLGGGLFTGAGTSGVRIPAANTTNAFPAHVRISRGDLIGTNTVSGLVSQLYTNAHPVNSQLLFWFDPSLGDGAAGSYPNVDVGGYVNLVNADIEPTSRFTVKRVKALAGDRLWIAAKLPNQGIVRVGGAKVRVLFPGWRTLVFRATGVKPNISFTPIHGAPFTRSLRPTPKV